MAKDPVKESAQRVADETSEQAERTDNVQPTPTQAENDAAKLGVESLSDLDGKTADGSEETPDEGRVADRPTKR